MSSKEDKKSSNTNNKSKSPPPKYDPRYCQGSKVYRDPQLLSKRKVGINNSTSKQMYKFGTQQRFHSYAKDYDAFFYNLPSVRDHFTTSFGHGCKSDFTKGVMNGKSHMYYDVPREFDLHRRNSPQYSFGFGREVCKRPELKIKKQTPGVGTYNLRKEFGSDALKFSIFGREWDHRRKSPSHSMITPGPGHYENKLKINLKGDYITSLYNNTWKIKFDGPERFKTKINKNPGPGNYEIGTMFNQTGMQYSSKFDSTIAKTMSNRPAEFYAPYKTTSLPGPGTYNAFSDFNGYNDEYKKCRCGRRLGHPPVFDGPTACSRPQNEEQNKSQSKEKDTSSKNKDLKIETDS